MARGAAGLSAKSAKVDETDEEEDPLVRRKEEVVRLFEETDWNDFHLLKLRESGKMTSHTLGWFQWVCDTFDIQAGHETRPWLRVKGAVYEGNLVNYAALQGSVEILRWLLEEKGCELNEETGFKAGWGGSVEVLENLGGRGYEFRRGVCDGAAREGHLEALKFLRGLDPPCPLDEKTCEGAAKGGHLEVLKFLRGLDPPCPWDMWTCSEAAEGGHLDVLKWARSQDPPCPWVRSDCRGRASAYGHQHVVDWIDQQEDESDAEEYSVWED